MTTYVAPITPDGMGAVATVALWGPEANVIAESLTSRQASDHEPFRLAWIGDRDARDAIILERRRNEFLLHCHGGPANVAWIMQLCTDRGAVKAPPEEWLTRSCTNAIQAEAAMALTRARTLRCASILLDQYHGALHHAIERLLVQPTIAEIDQLLAHATLGLHLINPWRVVLVGAPNAGKSSLCNAILGLDRAITSSVAGTTRDALAAWTGLDGWPVELIDTAGLRDHAAGLEADGMEMTRQRVEEADLCLWVLDPTQPWAMAWETNKPRIVVVNKSDLMNQWLWQPEQRGIESYVSVSAVTGGGVANLLQRIAETLVPIPPAAGAAVPFTEEHIQALQEARHATARGNLHTARAALAWLLRGDKAALA